MSLDPSTPDEALIRGAMAALSERGGSPSTPLPDPMRIWLRSQLRRRQIREQRALLPIRIAGAGAVLVLVVAAVLAPPDLAPLLQAIRVPDVAANVLRSLVALPILLLLFPLFSD